MNRRYGKTKQLLDEIERAYIDNPNAIIIGPNSPLPKYDPYNGGHISHNFYTDPEFPYEIPLQLAFINPEKYAELVEAKNKQFALLWDRAKPGIKNPIGKAIITCTVNGDDTPTDFNYFWNNSEPESTDLKHFFIPSKFHR